MEFSDLEALAASDDFHIIGISESWINTENRDFLAEYNLLNYSVISCERQALVTGDAVTKAHDKIKVSKTLSPDYIAPRVLKETKYQISKPTIIFNKSLNFGRLPDIWKLANFTPI